MQCAGCGHDNPPASKFCLECGAKLSAHCAGCGTALPGGSKFCNECGQPVASAPEGRASRFTAPESYTPKHLVEKILTSKAALEGERKQVTVLFADLKGSMELVADRDPEDARQLLDPVLEHMMQAVHRYEGTVNQVMGDGIMALFGAPLAHEDHALRACYAALSMQESVRRHAAEVRRRHGIAVRIRVGLNSGEVVVRAIGNDLKMDYTAVGLTTHLAARMEQLAEPGTTLLSPATVELVEGYVDVKSLGPMPVKGLPEPVEIYELTGAGTARTRLQASVSRGLTRFVGRDPEIAQLIRAMDAARGGHGQLVAVVGEPGIGKSRLYYEFTRSHRSQDWLVLEAGAMSHGKATSYLPVIDLLKEYFKIQESDDHRGIREKVTGKLLTLDDSLRPLLPAFLSLLDVPVDDPAWNAFDAAQRRRRTLDALKRLMLREAQQQPVIALFEDLHWIDSETQELLDTLIDSLPTARVLLLVNYRPEYSHDWSSKTYYTQLRLNTLPSESAGQLLESLLGTDGAMASLKALLTAGTAGNPLFLEESVRTLVETRVLVGERGNYRLTQPVQGIQMPATVQAILASRLDRLPVEEKRLLQSAAVIGQDIPFILLQEIAGLAEEELRRGLAHLQTAEFLYEVSLFPDLEYMFKHALTHDVSYGSLLHDRRRSLHAATVAATERLYAERLPEHVERLAHHAVQGELWDKAVVYLRQAGAKAVQRSAAREALTFFDRAVEAVEHLPEGREKAALGVDLRFDLQRVHQLLGQLERMLDRLREAEALAESLGDKRRQGRLTAHLARCHWWMGRPEHAAAECRRAQAMAAELDDRGLAVMAGYHLGLTYMTPLRGCHEAIEAFQWTLARLEGQAPTELFNLPFLPSVTCRAFPAWCHAELGEFGASATLAEEAIRVAEGAGHVDSLALAYWCAAERNIVQGDFARAIQLLDPAMELVRGRGSVYLVPWIAAAQGQAYALAGRIAEGTTLLEEAVEQSSVFKLMARHPATVTMLSDALLLGGRFDDALRTAERALVLTREHEQSGWEAYALRSLGDIQASAAVAAVESAEASYTAALELAERNSMRPLAARCHLGLGMLHRRTGQAAPAQRHLATALDMLGKMDMRLWMKQAE